MHPVTHGDSPAGYFIQAIDDFHFFIIIVLLQGYAANGDKLEQLQPFIFGDIFITMG